MRCHIFVVYLELCASYAADRLDSWQEDRSTGAVSRCNRHVSALRSTHTTSALSTAQPLQQFVAMAIAENISASAMR